MSLQNFHAIASIYKFELHRFRRTWLTGLLVPVITTTLYFVVFGGAIGSRMTQVDGIAYAAYIVPGLIMMSMLTESIFNASFGIYMPKLALKMPKLALKMLSVSIFNASFGIYMPKFTGTIYELLSAPISATETVIAYVGAAATKSLIVGSIIFATAHLFVDIDVVHPFAMAGFMILIAISFCLFGFILGIWAQGFEQLQMIPLLVVTPLTFLGGAFYSVHMLAEPWRTLTLFNPIVYLISGFRWTFFGRGDVAIEYSLLFIAAMLAVCISIIGWMFRTGYRLKK